ncbi:DUF4430 domain-containing protein [Caldibacillus lycopersici]|uniref:DUF4430 domain-containing protein n=1 Tax=Perspicuibacillus lycopersici TaxID=1325689 RepID=A0AAE3LN22_9BACI|nr:DUF4430 domain-containing protein [Perspicuibacillus lycopersici]MCU9613392.1 DUF4430 domain-containing protein [Perspicuibacillus lycopersici]
MRYFIKKGLLITLSLCLLLWMVGCEKDSVLPENSVTPINETASEQQEGEQPTGDAQKESVKSQEKSSEESADESSSNVEKAPPVSYDTNETANANSDDEKLETAVDTSEKQKEEKPENPKEEKQDPAPAPEPVNEVIVSIQGLNQPILANIPVTITSNETVISATIKLLKAKKIQYSITGSGATTYVESINNLYEFDHGPLSGWTVKKNGVLISRSSGSESVSNGDTIEWVYTTDYTEE